MTKKQIAAIRKSAEMARAEILSGMYATLDTIDLHEDAHASDVEGQANDAKHALETLLEMLGPTP